MIKVGQGDWPDQDGNVPSQKAVPAIQPAGLARRSLNRVQDNRLTPSLCVQRHHLLQTRQKLRSPHANGPRCLRVVTKTLFFPFIEVSMLQANLALISRGQARGE